MSRRPFLFRLIIPFGAMLIAVVTVCGALIYIASQHAARAQQIGELTRMTKLVRDSLAELNSSRPYFFPQAGEAIQSDPALSKKLKELAIVLATRVTLVNGDGVVLFDSEADPATMENHNDRPEIIEARRVGDGSAVRFSHTISEDAVYVAQPLNPAEPMGVILRMSYPRHTWSPLAVPAWAIVLAAIVLSSIAVIVLAVLLQRDWIDPVRMLSRAAQRMAAGEWRTRVTPEGDQEVRTFSDSLNNLAVEAEKQLSDLNAQRVQLRVLVDLLPDPIFLTDDQQNVALINTPAARLLNCKPPEAIGKPLASVLNETSLVTLFEQAKTYHAEPREVRLTRAGQEMVFQAVALRPPSGKGVLLVLRDVTVMASAVKMKTDFVANAGHELRTPIGAIKLAFETLQDVYQDDPEQALKCFTIAGGHLRRLEELLGDLLDLSRVESADAEVQRSTVEIDELLESTHAAFSTMARQKVVELVTERCDTAPTEIQSDRRLLQLILRNLVENAIKFTSAGGRVSITVCGEPHELVLRVSDNGIGISPEHRERVFERFYQVDAARSGTTGRGTGLGLAIVKHAANALDGKLDLQSEVGKGTNVEIRFALIQ